MPPSLHYVVLAQKLVDSSQPSNMHNKLDYFFLREIGLVNILRKLNWIIQNPSKHLEKAKKEEIHEER